MYPYCLEKCLLFYWICTRHVLFTPPQEYVLDFQNLDFLSVEQNSLIIYKHAKYLMLSSSSTFLITILGLGTKQSFIIELFVI